ncbi:unnamed protein product, partial [Ixodes hexagonus]
MSAFLPETDSEDELPAGWEERATLEGSVYYADHGARRTQWTHPRTGKRKRVPPQLPFGWRRAQGADGSETFIETATGRTSSTDPRLAFPVEEGGDVPPRQRFDASSTAMHVLHGRDLSGKTAVVTGASGGIGLETARALAHHGCDVVLACRDTDAAARAIASIRSERPSAKANVLPLDLASLSSVREFAAALCRTHPRLDVLVLNAGAFGLPHSVTGDGVETLFQTNHLGHFYLCRLLEPLLLRSAPARVVVVSSESHRFSFLSAANVSEERLNNASGRGYVSMLAYNDTKLCNLLMATELDRRLGPRGVRCNALHPGNMVASGLPRHWWPYRLLFALVRPFAKSLEQAAATSVFCAVAPELEGLGGCYFNNCYRCKPSAAAQDPRLATLVWETSEVILERALRSSGT